jgi:hypothetical protein
VHRREHGAGAHFVRQFQRQHQFAALAGHAHQFTGDQPAARSVFRLHAQTGFRTVREQSRHAAGARHAVPLIAQAAGEQA